MNATKETLPYIRIFKAPFAGREMTERLNQFAGNDNWFYGSTSHGASRGVYVKDTETGAKVRLAFADHIHSIDLKNQYARYARDQFLSKKFPWEQGHKAERKATGLPRRKFLVKWTERDGFRANSSCDSQIGVVDWYQKRLRYWAQSAFTGYVRIGREPRGFWIITTDDPHAVDVIQKHSGLQLVEEDYKVCPPQNVVCLSAAQGLLSQPTKALDCLSVGVVSRRLEDALQRYFDMSAAVNFSIPGEAATTFEERLKLLGSPGISAIYYASIHICADDLMEGFRAIDTRFDDIGTWFKLAESV